MRTQTLLALVAVLTCSACANQIPTQTSNAQQPRQFSGIQWDEATAATQMAVVSNSRLIMMR